MGAKVKGWLIGITLIVAVVVLVVPYYLFPRAAAWIIGYTLQSELGGTADVRVWAKYGWELAQGRFPAIEITGSRWMLDGLPIESFHLYGRNVRVDLISLLKHRQFVYISSADLQIRLSITEQALNQYFWGRIDPDQRFRIDLAQDKAVLHGVLELWQTKWNVSLVSEFSVRKPAAIVMTPVEFLIFDTRVPDILLELINNNYRFLINLDRLPFPVNLERIELFDEYLVLYGSGA